ncbi:MFS transporter [Paenibacillus mucilaginosus]|uniref:Transport protein n=2 Tax=Paenibacillus mucilaginosus TaxID=61624 RepID=H6NP30_9BACL|nr:MFS transporter [Paenibacillus mucilaginosus]AEI43457.1 transport protein [Paenibacillus mucilaginosus KNP414]AFC31104.1 transport protein [Paenibacillus mucilaginosus 3016]MCG7211997.1 MFS transporter [Paenibacillus mucilaginosus]WDM25014.1 MFS transporter [Paenibacillus mucilaginosus]WFA19686.1 MFS transporter [Paenibacillus mucilaginosus]
MVFSVLKSRQFRNYFLSDIISGFGVGMSTIGANWYLMDRTGSLGAIGFMLTLNVLAGFAISPLVGTLTDRFNRRSIIQGANWARAVLIFALALAFLFTGFHSVYLYLFTIINGMGWTVYMSASRSLVQELLTEKELINGNSLIEISLQVGMFLAGAASGILYKYYGFEFILILNAAAFVVSSLFLSRVRYTPLPVENKGESFFANFKEGLRYLKERPPVFLLGVVSIIPVVAVMIFNVVLPGYVNGPVQGDSVVFGLSDMFYGIGGLLSGFAAAPLARKLSNQGAITLFFLLASGILFAWAFSASVTLLYLGSVLLGLSNSSLRIIINTRLMETVSKSFMGRAMSVWIAISLLLQCVSATGLGVVLDRVAPGFGFAGIGALMLAGLVLYFVVAYVLKPLGAAGQGQNATLEP